MIAFILFVAVFAQETPDTTITGCGDGMYFNINSGEGGKCEIVNNCNKTFSDNLSGCEKCNEGFFNFRGQCHACSCGKKLNADGTGSTDDVIQCKDNLGCPECGKGYVMVETKNQDGSVMYTCTALPTTKPDLTQQGIVFSEYEIHGNDTHEHCVQWGKRGCVKCDAEYKVVLNEDGTTKTINLIKAFYVNASMCYENVECTQIEFDSEDELKKGNYKCTNCTQATNSNEKSFYLLNQACVQCDGNCTKCNVTNGVCKECFPGYYPLDENSKKCYQCDPNCDIESCIQLNDPSGLPQGSCTKCRSDASRNETYYLVANKYCIRMPASCKRADTDKGCVECNEGYFLVPHHYNGIDNFHYKIAGKRIGMCVPYQEACPDVNRTETGCKGCSAGYVLDTMKWNHDGQDYSIGICSGAMSVLIVALIAFLVLLF